MLYRLTDQASVSHPPSGSLLLLASGATPACYVPLTSRYQDRDANDFPPGLASVLGRESYIGRRRLQLVRRQIIVLCISLSALVMSACGSLKVTLSSEVPQVDAAGKPLPVVVRLYQLSSKDKFQKADFLSLLKNDKTLLDKDVLWREETTLRPNTEMAIKEERKKGAKYFAVMALFRDKDKGTVWRQVVDLDELWILSVNVKVQKRTVTAN